MSRRSPQGVGGSRQLPLRTFPSTNFATKLLLTLMFFSRLWGTLMKYVYILESLDSEHHYIGLTDEPRARSPSTMPVK
jgi:hypothetical protein